MIKSMRFGDAWKAATALRRRVPRGDERGMTLLELLLVVFIIGILLAITIISSRGFRDRAGDASASANARAALPAVTAYFADNHTYAGMTLTALSAYDAGLSQTLVFSNLSATTFCVQDTVRGITAHFAGPGGTVADGAC